TIARSSLSERNGTDTVRRSIRGADYARSMAHRGQLSRKCGGVIAITAILTVREQREPSGGHLVEYRAINLSAVFSQQGQRPHHRLAIGPLPLNNHNCAISAFNEWKSPSAG